MNIRYTVQQSQRLAQCSILYPCLTRTRGMRRMVSTTSPPPIVPYSLYPPTKSATLPVVIPACTPKPWKGTTVPVSPIGNSSKPCSLADRSCLSYYSFAIDFSIKFQYRLCLFLHLVQFDLQC